MFKYKMPLMVLAVVCVLSGLSTVRAKTRKTAKTWYLEQSEHWKPLSAESKEALTKANTLFRKGKFGKAVRSYDKFLEGCDPNSELYAEALEKQFHIAKEFLAGRKIRVLGVFKIKGYAAGEKIMERISERAGNATIGLDAAVEVAKSYEERGKFEEEYYDLAYLKWSEIFDTYDKRLRISSPWPTGEVGKDALLGKARCRHNAYKGPEYDVSGLIGRALIPESYYESAKGLNQRFSRDYSEAVKRFDIEGKLKQINEQVAYKDFSTGRYYQRTGNRQAANLYYQMVIRDWPDSKAAKMANKMLVENLGSKEITK